MYENVSLGNDEAAICKTQYTEHSTQNTASYSPFRLKDFAFWGFYGLKINYFRQNDIFKNQIRIGLKFQLDIFF